MDPSGGFQLDFEELLLYLQLSLSISECNPCLTLTVMTGGFICLLNKVQNSLKKQPRVLNLVLKQQTCQHDYWKNTDGQLYCIYTAHKQTALIDG